MPQAIDQIYYFYKAFRISQNGEVHENAQETIEAVVSNPAEQKRMLNLPGRASGAVDFPLYDLDSPTAELLLYYIGRQPGGLIMTPDPTAEKFAIVSEAYVNRAVPDPSSGIAKMDLGLTLDTGQLRAFGQNIYTDVGGSGVTGVIDGPAVTFAGGILVGDSMLVALSAWSNTGGGTLDSKLVSAPLSDFVGSTDQHVFTQLNAATMSAAHETAFINGAITDPEWRLEVTAVGGGGTWFLQLAGAIGSQN